MAGWARPCTCLNDHYPNLELSTLSSQALYLLTIEFVNAVYYIQNVLP